MKDKTKQKTTKTKATPQKAKPRAKTKITAKTKTEVKTKAVSKRAEDQRAIKYIVKTLYGYQKQRIAIMDRLGLKKDGTSKKVAVRKIAKSTVDLLTANYLDIKEKEKELVKLLGTFVVKFPIYTEFWRHIDGVAIITAGVLLSEINIHIADTASKIHQYAGINAEPVRGKIRKQITKTKYEIITTDTWVPGDKKTPGFICPYNQFLKTKVMGVMAANFRRKKNEYAMTFYYPDAKRRAAMDWGTANPKRKVDPKGPHQRNAALRYMMKKFLSDTYAVWRELEGLPVRPPYQVEKLGHPPYSRITLHKEIMAKGTPIDISEDAICDEYFNDEVEYEEAV